MLILRRRMTPENRLSISGFWEPKNHLFTTKNQTPEPTGDWYNSVETRGLTPQAGRRLLSEKIKQDTRSESYEIFARQKKPFHGHRRPFKEKLDAHTQGYQTGHFHHDHIRLLSSPHKPLKTGEPLVTARRDHSLSDPKRSWVTTTITEQAWHTRSAVAYHHKTQPWQDPSLNLATTKDRKKRKANRSKNPKADSEPLYIARASPQVRRRSHLHQASASRDWSFHRRHECWPRRASISGER